MKPKNEKPKVYCLYHERKDCICIKPVTTQKQLDIRIKNREGLAKFGIKA